MTLSSLINGDIIGWSVAWLPPINAGMIRRGLLPKERGGGFWSAWPIRVGACTGDFIWAFYVSVGAGVLLTRSRSAADWHSLVWRCFYFWQVASPGARGKSTVRIALSSFNHLRMSGSQPTQSARVRQSLAIARPWLSVH